MRSALRSLVAVALLAALLASAADEKSAAKLPADLALMPTKTAAFISFQPGPLLEHSLAKLAGSDGLAALEKHYLLGISPANVERATLVLPNLAEGAVLVQTRKPYDRERLLKAAGDLREEQLGGRTLYLGKGKAVWFANDRCFVVGLDGAVASIEALDPDGKGPEHLAGAARLAAEGKHLFVVGADGAEVVRALANGLLSDEDRIEEDRKTPPEKMTRDWVVARLSLARLPYKPLLLARAATLAVRPGEHLDGELTLAYADAEQATEGESSLRTARYVLREGLPRLMTQSLFKPRAPEVGAEILKSGLAAMQDARISRNGTAVRIAARMRVSPVAMVGFAALFRESHLEQTGLNNLKQIALAMHSYHDVANGMPAQAILDNAGKPLLSWRVAILPYIEQQHLYNEFRRDEAWDSPHNKKLLARMPDIYKHPTAKPKDPHSTYYQVFAGPKTPFTIGAKQGPSLARIFDGSSNTIMVAEAGEAVPWSKPVDLLLKADKPLPKLGGHFKGAVHAAFMDGSAKMLRADLEEKVWRMLIDPADGMPVPGNIELK